MIKLKKPLLRQGLSFVLHNIFCTGNKKSLVGQGMKCADGGT